MYRYELTDGIQADLARLEKRRVALDARGVLPRRWQGRLRRDLEAESVAASTSMEGVPVTVDEVRRILVGDRPRNVAESDVALVAGYRDAMGFVLRRADSTGFAWHSELFIGIHDRVMAGDRSAGAGDFRHSQVFVGSPSRGTIYTPPEPESVPHLIGDLTDWLTDAVDEPPAIRAAMAHVRLAGIHPFADGNGRTARIVATLAMYRGGYTLPELTSLEEWWGRHLTAYHDSFICLGDRWDPDGDVTQFVRAHLSAQIAQVEALALRHATEREVWTAVEDVATEDLSGLPRLADALFDAFFGRTMTNRYYRSLTGVGAATASSDLRRLQSAGLLQAKGAGRSTTYVGTARLLSLVACAAGLSLPPADAPLDSQRDLVMVGIAELHRRE